jgi:hypothetical protein
MVTVCGAIIKKKQADGVVRYCTCPATRVRDDGTMSCGRHTGPMTSGGHTVPSTMVGECSICLSECSTTNCYVTSCKHTFHKKCIDRWLVNHNSCPLCRNKIGTKAISVPVDVPVDTLTSYIFTLAHYLTQLALTLLRSNHLNDHNLMFDVLVIRQQVLHTVNTSSDTRVIILPGLLNQLIDLNITLSPEIPEIIARIRALM